MISNDNISDGALVKNALVSIMIPTFNQEKYVGRAIESALRQTYSPLEIVISDDCSTDGTGGIVSNYLSDPKVKYFRQTENLGRVGNYRKNLFDQTRGEWVINLDGDDYFFTENYIEEAMTALSKNDNSSVVLVCADRFESDEDVSVKRESLLFKWRRDNGREILLNYFNGNRKYNIWHLTSIYRRDLATKIDFYRHNITSSDQESLFRLILHGDILYTDNKVAVWQFHEQNASKEMNPDKTVKNLSEYRYIHDYALENGLVDAPYNGPTGLDKEISLSA